MAPLLSNTKEAVDLLNGGWIDIDLSIKNLTEFKMTKLRQLAVSWFVAITAIAVASLAACFIYLREEIPTDPAFIATKTDQVAAHRSFNIKGARESYSEEEVVAFLTKANQADFDRKWLRVVSIIGALYSVLSLGILATTLRKEVH